MSEDIKKPRTKRTTAEGAGQPQKPRGAQKGNRNAAKAGEDLRWEMFLSKARRGFFEEWFLLRFGRLPYSDDELREAARQIANVAIDRAILEEFERHHPGRTNSGGEVF
jgi:hypothetical protein